ncbi:hypothetical protein BCR37DRAFT_53699 [Protomyces lactucae-debilis]|uniref:Uncharacterized protein n=1 Tax=Protomyces lactucae-debilis TaxID=2754530 RepID=A0A1Y2FA52_PROLT|nr:uncharacterized protein BCR37DRAFT_53699 [Protomyces lactucae-debilis]ORY80800.1 hypothetical protein BCR37DRAFT_53699 [Protomyces lactucae-debilis]
MRLPNHDVASSAVMITIGLAMFGQTAISISITPTDVCKLDPRGKCPAGFRMTPFKDCLQLQGCLFYAEVRNPLDKEDRFKTWKALRGQIGPDNDAFFVFTNTSNGPSQSVGSKYWPQADFVCWRARTERDPWSVYTLDKVIGVKQLTQKVGGVVYKGYINCDLLGVIQKEVHCCNECS